MALKTGGIADVSAGLSRARREAPMLLALLWELRKKPLGAFSLLIIMAMILLAIFGSAISPHAPDALVGKRLQGTDPGGDLKLGTDALGRDILSRLIYGFRITVIVGFGAVAVSTAASVLIGVTSGYWGGIYDTILQRVIDAVMAFPTLIFLLIVVAALGPGLFQLIFTLGLISVAGTSRVIRSAVLTVRSMQYIEASRASGAGPVRTMVSHVLPNVMAPILVMASISLGGVILAEASLSFLGLGISNPGQPTWGRMLFDARQVVATQPAQSLWPGLLISLAVFSFNMLGDALRDVSDPRLRRSR